MRIVFEDGELDRFLDSGRARVNFAIRTHGKDIEDQGRVSILIEASGTIYNMPKYVEEAVKQLLPPTIQL